MRFYKCYVAVYLIILILVELLNGTPTDTAAIANLFSFLINAAIIVLAFRTADPDIDLTIDGISAWCCIIAIIASLILILGYRISHNEIIYITTVNVAIITMNHAIITIWQSF